MRNSKKFVEVTVQVPGNTFPARFRHTSQYGFEGCQGFVQPGVLKEENGKERKVQSKVFYTQSSDDRGEPFTQNPREEVEKSYGAFAEMQTLGFKVLPFFGMMWKKRDKPVLILDDLRKGNTQEIFDEKHLNQNKKVQQTVRGRTYEQNPREVVRKLANYPEIRFELMCSNLLQTAHGIQFGWTGGMEHMITRDPTTNQGDVFVCDVGEFHRQKSRYREKLPVKELLRVPEEAILAIYQHMLEVHHPRVSAEKVYGKLKRTNPQKKRGLDVLYQAAIGASLTEHMGGWMGRESFARRLFPKHEGDKTTLDVKMYLLNAAEHYREITQTGILHYTPQAVRAFRSAQSERALESGLDIAYMAALDRRLQEIQSKKDELDNKLPLFPVKEVAYDRKGMPQLTIFEDATTPIPPTLTVSLHARAPFASNNTKSDQYRIFIEVPWQEAYQLEISGGTNEPTFKPSQVRGIEKNGAMLTNFDAKKVRVERARPLHGIYYVYGSEYIHVQYPREDEDK